MKQIATLVLSSFVLLTTACGDIAKTSDNSPNPIDKTVEAPTAKTAQTNQNDAASKVRKDQLDSDIRAREQRNNVTGGDSDRANSDLASEVRSKLEANIPNSSLAITAKDGGVVVSGSVPTLDQLDKIKSLAMQIKGVKSVDVAAKVATPTPEQKP
ncbi:MAG: BON domain-containing protein [Pseudanabaena sp. CAN_BIN31]|nr:BON domain-containing protein [Pseudanabaena sp. CAN_BIN31]